MAFTFVNVGAAATGDGSASLVPALPASLQDNDLMVLAVYTREATDGVITTPAGWTPLTAVGGHRSTAGIIAAYYRLRQTGDAAPTVAHTGLAAGDSIIAQIAAWRGNHLTSPLDVTGTISEWDDLDMGPVEGVAVGPLGLAICIAGKQDDWTSVAVLSDGLYTWIEVGEPDETTGTDAGLAWDYMINPYSIEKIIPDETFLVTGGTTQEGKGIMLSFNVAFTAIANTDAVVYCAQGHPTSDSGEVGGSIDIMMRAVFTDPAAADDVEALSASAADTVQSLTIKGRTSGGAIVQETKTLNGTTAVIFSVLGVIERIEEARLSGPAAGIITIRRSVAGATIQTIPVGELGFRRIFAYAWPHPSATKDYYEKVFFKNNHLFTTIQSPAVVENADPSGKITFTLAASVNDSAKATNRNTAPAAADTDPDTYTNTTKNAPAGLAPGSAIGIWLKMSLAAADNFKNTYTLELTGTVP